MQRYFVPTNQIDGEQFYIVGDDAHHISRVLRMKAGDEVVITDDQGQSYLVRLLEIVPERVTATTLRQLDENTEAQVHITLVQGLPKGDKMDLIVQKCTEIGVAEFVPVQTKRTVVQYDEKKEAKRRERWQKIAKEAAEQSHRSRIPRVTDVVDLQKWLTEHTKANSEFDLVVAAYEAETVRGLRQQLLSHPELRSIAVIVGPEGGFDESEVCVFQELGIPSVSLGRRILRTETAGIAASVMILYHYEQMGG